MVKEIGVWVFKISWMIIHTLIMINILSFMVGEADMLHEMFIVVIVIAYFVFGYYAMIKFETKRKP